MRLKISKSKSSEILYMLESTYINSKHSTRIVERLGTIEEVKIKAKNENPYDWAKRYIDQQTLLEKEGNRPVYDSYNPKKKRNIQHKIKLNGGYLCLQDIYYKLGLNNICDEITNKYQFKYDLNNILSNLIYSRVIYPSSKLKTLELSKNFIEQPNFELHDIYRALEVISKETDFIQSELYKNSLKYSKRNDKVLFYDCTNYYFEIEQEDDYKKYGKSKENRPNPIVGMGLFLDGDGIPLAFSTFPGNQNEQPTLKPLEEKIINDFGNSKFVVCTDAGLSSKANRKFNSTNNRKFVTTQSIKMLKDFLKDEALDLTKGWKLPNDNKVYDISSFRGYERTDDENENLRREKKYEDSLKTFKNVTFYKDRWIKEDGIEQRLIVTYSVKYQEYQKKIRETQTNRALKMIDKNPKKIGNIRENDPKRFITTTTTTPSGEVAEKNHYSINTDKINEEAKYDGLYAVCTNLQDSPEEIIKINKQRWEIEESFRIMKSEFKARPVYLSNEDRINAHFTTCFLALVIYRYLERKLKKEYTVTKIIETLRNMEYKEIPNEGYVPLFENTEITEDIYKSFFKIEDTEILNIKNFNKILKEVKKSK
ncbi:MAG: IS1634 family transposase [Bacilli bacterium]